MKKISRNQQRLLWWLITDYAGHMSGNTVISTNSEFWKYKAKVDLLKRYKATQSELSDYVPFQSVKWEGTKTADEARDILLQELQLLLLSNEAMLSLSKHLMSNERAISLTNFIFDFFLENEVEMRKEIIELYKSQQRDKFTYGCLLNKKCAVCFNPDVDFEHFRSVSAEFGTYAKDDGTGLYISLCRKHHSEKHNIGAAAFEKKYKVSGIRLTDKQIPIIKEKYPNHMKAYNCDG